MSENEAKASQHAISWPWAVTVLLDCIPQRDDKNGLVSVQFKVSLGQDGDEVEAGTMDPASVAEGIQLAKTLLSPGESDDGPLPEDASTWL